VSPEISAEDSPVRLVFGAHRIRELGALAAEYGATRVLLVSDPGVENAGHVATAKRSLEAQSVQVQSFLDVEENPTTETVKRASRFAAGEAIDLIVGLGGGSAMDTAKGCSLLLTQKGEVADFEGVGNVPLPTIPLICVPTTAGTGSEVQSAALLSDTESHRKIVIIDPKIRPQAAILDPTLSLSQPRVITEAAGLDALGHALETAVCTARNEDSWRYSVEAFRLGFRSFQKILESPADLPARASMLIAASYAGLAIEASMLGAAHACANPLTQHFGLRHGFAVGAALPAVIRFNADVCSTEYAMLATAAGICPEGHAEREAANELAMAMENTLRETGAISEWSALSVPSSKITTLATEAAQQRTASFNPRPAGAQEFEELYTALMTGLRGASS